ncbi:MAG TPA: hypothetical protein VH740_28055 [Vicinamibacterales bacterium]|jgi:hypothetical protein
MLPRAIRAFAGITLISLLVPIVAAAQQKTPLAEVARKEAERRKGVKETQKVITTKDLPESARKPAAAPAPASGEGAGTAAAPASAAAPQSAAAAASDQKDEKYWRNRITQAREGLRRNEAFAEALQSRINALTTDFVNRDDPVQKAKLGEDRAKAIEELARVKSDVEQAKRQIDDVEEEARKAGVPPGWLR